MKKTILYIDTDVGVDDIIAICMLAASDKFDIRGVSVVNGVMPAYKGLNILSRILKYIGITVPMYLGVTEKDQASDVQFSSIDRERAKSLTLLKKIKLPGIKNVKYGSLRDLQTKIIKEKRAIKFLCLGPLSNFSILIRNKSLKKQASDITIMGGAVNVPGNVAPEYLAEYNFRLDPQAANKVLNSGLPINLVPIDATRFVPAKINNTNKSTRRLLQNFLSRLSAYLPNSPEAKLTKEIILNNKTDFSNFYDPLAAAILLNPRIISSSVKNALKVSTSGLSKGMCQKKPNGNKINIIQQVNSESFYKLLSACIRKRKLLRSKSLKEIL